MKINTKFDEGSKEVFHLASLDEPITSIAFPSTTTIIKEESDDDTK